MLANAVKETTTTTGTGTVTLAAASGFARFSAVFGVGVQASYCIADANGNREWGMGTVSAGNTLARSKVMATLVSGTYTTNGATAITLSGTAEVFVDMHSGIWASVPGATRTAQQYLVSHGCMGAIAQDSAMAANELRGMLCVIARPYLVDAFFVDVRTAGGTAMDVTVYQGSDDGPGARMIDVQTFDTSTTGGKTAVLSTPVVLMPGTYYVAALSDGTPTCRGFSYASVPGLGRSNPAVTSPESYLRKTGWSYASGLPNPAPSGFGSGPDTRSPFVWLRGNNV